MQRTEKQDIYTRITNQIVSHLEKGVRPWVRPWNADQARWCRKKGRSTQAICAGSRATCWLKPCQMATALFQLLPGHVLIRMRV